MNDQDRRRNLIETVGNLEDIERARKIIDEHKWRFAWTLRFVPHWYSLKDWENMDDFNWLINFFWDNGLDICYGKKTTYAKRYWFDHETGWYYFMDPADYNEDRTASEVCQLINRAKIERYAFYEDTECEPNRIRCRLKRKDELES